MLVAHQNEYCVNIFLTKISFEKYLRQKCYVSESLILACNAPEIADYLINT